VNKDVYVKSIFYATMHIGRSRSSKVTDFDTNRKRVLVRHITLVPLHNLSEIYYRLTAQDPTAIPP